MVPDTGASVVCPAGPGFRPGMVPALPVHGHFRLAHRPGTAVPASLYRTASLRRAAWAEPGVVVGLLSETCPRHGSRRNSGPVGRDRRHDHYLRAARSVDCLADGALLGLGQLRFRPQPRILETKPLNTDGEWIFRSIP